MNTRPANAGDLAVLFEVHRFAFRHHIEALWGWAGDWQRQNFAAQFAGASTCVIEVDGCTAGYIQTNDETERIHVQNMAIAAEFQGQGTGSRLLTRLQSDAAVRNVSLQLGVFRTNRPAQRLYRRLGFRPVGETATHLEMSWPAAQPSIDAASL